MRAQFLTREEVLLFFTVSKLALRPICPPIKMLMAVKQPRHEAGNSIPSTAEVKKVCGAKPPPSQSTGHSA